MEFIEDNLDSVWKRMDEAFNMDGAKQISHTPGKGLPPKPLNPSANAKLKAQSDEHGKKCAARRASGEKLPDDGEVTMFEDDAEETSKGFLFSKKKIKEKALKQIDEALDLLNRIKNK